MPINPLISLSGVSPETTSFTEERAKAQAVEINEEKLTQARVEGLSEREKARLTSTILGAAELDSHLQSDNLDGARSFLTQRRQDLGKRIAAGENVDTRETDEALAMLDSDPKALKEITGSAIRLGKQTGILKTDSQLNGFSSTPAGIQYLDKINELEAAGNYRAANELRAILKTQDRGTEKDASGNIILTPGAADAKKDISKAVETGKKEAQLQYEPTIEGNKAKAKSDAEFLAKAQQNLPRALDQADYLTEQLDALLTHPGKKYAVGGTSILPILPGTDAASFKARLEQVNGEQFLQAFESLKGGGQITEIEGKKATDAIARMQTAQKEEDFDEAVKEFKEIVLEASKRARAAAGSGADNSATPKKSKAEIAADDMPSNLKEESDALAAMDAKDSAPKSEAKRLKYNPDTGDFE